MVANWLASRACTQRGRACQRSGLSLQRQRKVEDGLAEVVAEGFFVAGGTVALAEEGVGVVFVWLEPDVVEVAGDRALLALKGEELAVVHDPFWPLERTQKWPRRRLPHWQRGSSRRVLVRALRICSAFITLSTVRYSYY